QEAAEPFVGAAERALVALRHGPPVGALGTRDLEDLVVDVGDVPAERGLVAARLQPADQDVKAHPGPDVPDVRRGLHRGATQVQRCLPRLHRGELALGAGCCVIEAERHAAKATAGQPGRRPIIPARRAVTRCPWTTPARSARPPPVPAPATDPGLLPCRWSRPAPARVRTRAQGP